MKTASRWSKPLLALALATGFAQLIRGEPVPARGDTPNAAAKAPDRPAAIPAAPLAAIPAATPAPIQTATIDLGDGVKMEFVLIRPGSFVMGTDEDNDPDSDASPRRRVTLTQPFYLGKYEVTQEQWEKVMGSNPSHFQGAKLPVETVSWNACQEFLAKLQARTGRKFALPTEAQWEFACRAGTSTPWSFGNSDATMGDYAWSRDNSGQTTHAVGEKKPNASGLYDMHGNVAEWCADWYAKHTYSGGVATDPTGPSAGDSRIARGGAWGDDSGYLKCTYRNCSGSDNANEGIGLRCVMLVAQSSP
ncbi:MAG TPA: formylglycine-generating enzyme family protein [Pirellulales bacterium]|nr:formylglycine-generating enzyme family protein [Pirellulales bacterium]